MLKSNPKTIADLKINWTFEEQNIYDPMGIVLAKDFYQLNPKLIPNLIKKDEYSFQIKNKEYIIYTYGTSLCLFFNDINYNVALYEIFKTLDRFELLSENTFCIHVKE